MGVANPLNYNRKYNIRNFNKEAHASECCICLEGYEMDENVAELKCNTQHIFHKGCIDDWLKKKQQCPLCNAKVKV